MAWPIGKAAVFTAWRRAIDDERASDGDGAFIASLAADKRVFGERDPLILG